MRPNDAPSRARRQWRAFLPGRAAVVRVFALSAIWGVIALALIAGYLALGLPDIRQTAVLERRPSIMIVDERGEPVIRYGEMFGEYLQVADLPPHLVQAVLAIEDRRFYEHAGLDPRGIARAALNNAALWAGVKSEGMVQGGSTITQQLAKNLFLKPDRTLLRKVQEAMLAVWLERVYEKDAILAAYLNRVYFGSGAYGIDAAARIHFNKTPRALDLRESAILAGLLQSPSRFSPQRNPDLAQRRALLVLNAMAEAGFIAREQAAALALEPTRPRRKPGQGDSVRYYADAVIDEVTTKIGPIDRDLIVTTGFDRRLQTIAEARLEALMASEGAQAAAAQAAFIAMTPEGRIRAIVGGVDYRMSQFNRATQAKRQPGSAFKPFVFLTALENGYTPATEVNDTPFERRGWRPGNFTGRSKGVITLEEALADSVNTATVRVLDQVGIARVQETARRLGFGGRLPSDLSLALGTGEVTLESLTGAYAPFANGGTPVEPHTVLHIADRHGTVLYAAPAPAARPAIMPWHVAEMNRMLAAVVLRGTGTAAAIDRPVAGKTGTSQDFRDAWFIGFSADYVAGVWLGNDDNAPMRRVTGGGLPARLWAVILREAHRDLSPRPLPGQPGAAPLLLAGRDPAAGRDEPAAPGATQAPAPRPAGEDFGAILNRLTGGLFGSTRETPAD
jgi:penicillin-binding protein 1A